MKLQILASIAAIGLLIASNWIGVMVAWGLAAVIVAPLYAWTSKAPAGMYLKVTAAAFVILLTFRVAVIGPVCYRMGYAKGIATVKAHMEAGTTHSFAQWNARHRWCMVPDPTLPAYRHFCGYKVGVYDALPEHAGDPQYARQILEDLGAKFTIDEYDRVMSVKLINSGLDDTNVHWLSAFQDISRILIVSSPLSDASRKQLLNFRGLTTLTIVDSRLSESSRLLIAETYPDAHIRVTNDPRIAQHFH